MHVFQLFEDFLKTTRVGHYKIFCLAQLKVSSGQIAQYVQFSHVQ